MSDIWEIEARLNRLEQRVSQNELELDERLAQVRRFQRFAELVASAAVALGLTVALLYALTHVLPVPGWWPELFAVPIGLVTFAIVLSRLEASRLTERRRKTEPDQAAPSDR